MITHLLKRKFTRLYLVVISSSAVAVLLLIALPTLASTNDLSAEAENGTLSGAAATLGDGSASGELAIKFGSSPSCPGSPNTPDGSDGNGGCWPGTETVGLPSGTTLSAYTGPCNINDASTTITVTAQDVRAACPSGVIVYAGTFTASDSQLPRIEAYGMQAQVTAIDSDIDGGTDINYGAVSEADAGPATGRSDFAIVVKNSNIHHGKNAVSCDSWCDIENSYLHDNYYTPGSQMHEQAFINSGSGPGSTIIIKHNAMICYSADNCTGDLSLFGDFNTVTGVTVDNNLFLASQDGSFYYAAYLGYEPGKDYPNPDHVVFTNNVFQKGASGKSGMAAPYTGWLLPADGGTGNVWSNNKYDDGTVIAEPTASG